MRVIFIILFLVSFGSVSMGGVGDVYYCSMENNVKYKDHKLLKVRLENFKFKWEENKIVFGSGDNFFRGTEMNIIDSWPVIDKFNIRDNISLARYDNGHFYYSGVSAYFKEDATTAISVTTITATCDKF